VSTLLSCAFAASVAFVLAGTIAVCIVSTNHPAALAWGGALLLAGVLLFAYARHLREKIRGRAENP